MSRTPEQIERAKKRDQEGFARVIAELRSAVRATVQRKTLGFDPEVRAAVIDVVTHQVFWYYAPDLAGPGGMGSYVGKITDRVIEERMGTGVDA